MLEYGLQGGGDEEDGGGEGEISAYAKAKVIGPFGAAAQKEGRRHGHAFTVVKGGTVARTCHHSS